MEYEHEKKIRSWVELELFRYGHHLPEYDAEVIKELEEVYAKAKAFDDIRRIESLCYYVEYDKYSGIDREAFKTHTFTKNTLKTIRNWEDK